MSNKSPKTELYRKLSLNTERLARLKQQHRMLEDQIRFAQLENNRLTNELLLAEEFKTS